MKNQNGLAGIGAVLWSVCAVLNFILIIVHLMIGSGNPLVLIPVMTMIVSVINAIRLFSRAKKEPEPFEDAFTKLGSTQLKGMGEPTVKRSYITFEELEELKKGKGPLSRDYITFEELEEMKK